MIELIDNYGVEKKYIDIMNDFIDFSVKKLKLKNVLFNVIIINDDDIHEINKKYRGIDRATDVISFALEDEKEYNATDIRVLGDIYISYDMALKQAKDYGHSIIRELCFLQIHGLLHLLGYDHMNKEDEIKMFSLQKELLEEYGIKKES